MLVWHISWVAISDNKPGLILSQKYIYNNRKHDTTKPTTVHVYTTGVARGQRRGAYSRQFNLRTLCLYHYEAACYAAALHPQLQSSLVLEFLAAFVPQLDNAANHRLTSGSLR